MRALRWIALLCPTLLLALLSCDSEGNLVDPEDFQAVVDLVNASDLQPVHLFSASRNETFPCCQVATGGARNVQHTLRQLDNYVFRAGRNGTIVDQAICRTDASATSGDAYSVRYTDAVVGDPLNGVLSCAGSGWTEVGQD